MNYSEFGNPSVSIFKQFGVTRYEGRLNNNIRVILFYRMGAPISTTAVLKSGSKYDPISMPGVAHFIEHMIVNGSPKFPSKDRLAEHIESVGGRYGAKTGQEYMMVETEVAEKTDYGRVADIFEATLCKPLMDKKVFDNEKSVIIKEIKNGDSNPVQVLVKTMRKLFFRGTTFEHQIVGDEESIANLKYDEVISEYVRLLDKSRITFVASGDISLEELVSHLNKLTFLEGNELKESSDNFVFSNEDKSLVTYFDVPQTQILLGVPAPILFTKDSLYLNIVGNILAQGRASRLVKRLRYEKGLVYSIGLSRYGGNNFGSWVILTDTSTDKVQEVVDEILNEIKDLNTNGIKNSELEFVKNKIIKSMKRSMQTSNDWVDSHSLAEVFSSDKYNVDVFVNTISGATAQDLKEVIDKYLRPDFFKLALCGKAKDIVMRYDL